MNPSNTQCLSCFYPEITQVIIFTNFIYFCHFFHEVNKRYFKEKSAQIIHVLLKNNDIVLRNIRITHMVRPYVYGPSPYGLEHIQFMLLSTSYLINSFPFFWIFLFTKLSHFFQQLYVAAFRHYFNYKYRLDYLLSVLLSL